MRTAFALSLLLCGALACSDGGSTDTGSVSPGATGGAAGQGGAAGPSGSSGQAGATAGKSGAPSGGQAGQAGASGVGAGQAGAGQGGSAAGQGGSAAGQGGSGAGQGGVVSGGQAGQGGSAAGGPGGAGAGGQGSGGTPGCCSTDAECEAQGLDRCVASVCRAPLLSGQCWGVADCKEGLVCQAAAPCPCGLDCDADQPGSCQLPAGACCMTAADCDGQGLLNPRCVEGRCKALPDTEPGQAPCWLDADCASGEACAGVSVCGCQEDGCEPVPDAMGHCQKSAPGPGECRTQTDCTEQGALCAPPGSPPSCGICMQPVDPCFSDGDCAALGASSICAQPPCVCGSTCTPGCQSDEECAVGQACDAGHHCVPRGCALDPDCPPNFRCNQVPESGVCERAACTDDLECEGRCVEGFCHEGFGQCQLPAP